MFRFHWSLVLAIGCLHGCNKAQPVGSDPERAPGKVVSDKGEAEERERAVPAALTRERLLASLSQHPEPFLMMRSAGAAPFRPLVGRSVALQLTLPNGQRWADVGVTRFAVRSGVSQETLGVDQLDATGAVTHKFGSPGPAMFMTCVGAKNDPRSNAWEHASYCSKVIVDVGGAIRRSDEPEADVMTETGMPIEVVPLKSPIGMPVGSELPASFHFMNDEEAGIEVAALRPDGTVDRQVTNRSGVAYFTITQAGRWVIRLVEVTPEGERTGELVFDIAGGVR
jgi:hypothetical protein